LLLSGGFESHSLRQSFRDLPLLLVNTLTTV
jgi:hypothetical protein